MRARARARCITRPTRGRHETPYPRLPLAACGTERVFSGLPNYSPLLRGAAHVHALRPHLLGARGHVPPSLQLRKAVVETQKAAQGVLFSVASQGSYALSEGGSPPRSRGTRLLPRPPRRPPPAVNGGWFPCHAEMRLRWQSNCKQRNETSV